MLCFSSLVVLSVLSAVNAFIGPAANMVVSNARISPDGFPRDAIVVGGTFPGPVVRGLKGSHFRLNVVNQLTNNVAMLRTTSIHWHGLFMKGTSWADGPVGVTQCPISAGQSFLYDFNASDQAGTFWYHSHHSTQYCDGLRGAMVIYDSSDPHLDKYDIDNEATIITLADWYHVPARLGGRFPTPDSTLFNGKGRAFGGDPTAPLAVINVSQGLRYRFRLVSISCDPNYVFSIDSHTMTIIEVDGVNVQPLTVDSIQIFAGQRYSFVLNANQPNRNYWIRANPNLGNRDKFDGGINSAILRYSGAAVEEPAAAAIVPSTNPLRETSLRPLERPGAPGRPVIGGVDRAINLAMGFNQQDLTFTINGASFVPPDKPVLLQLVSGARPAQDLLPAGSVYYLKRNQVVELSIPGGAVGGPHPFHLHGHTFDVVRSAGSSATNFANPVRRDVVSAGDSGDNVTIRFTTDNPGPWILHCHIDYHLETGLAVVFAEDPETIQTEDPPTPWDDLCPKYDSVGDL
ncbi:laccase [Crucibulum laeve]|uniref:Laccase n=1 Tax=Crucibulum laeve TaxID=68775 RepID=A0A5C3LPY4_9AGAR|nr:laccase [Crucibulum laeve]